MTYTWIDRGQGLRPAGAARTIAVHDDRYAHAMAVLRESGRDSALASFTFDPEADGSIVVVADHLEEYRVSSRPESVDYEITDDGVAAWMAAYEKMSSAISNGSVSKVVLARQVRIEAEKEIDTSLLADRLASLNSESFIYNMDGLVGASPELLIRVESGNFATQVLAGTAVEQEGLAGPKIAEEHKLAAQSALMSLQRHLADWQTSATTIRQGRMLHAATVIRGELRPGTGILDVLADLHPTAAVCGTPRAQSMDLIRSHEPPRGRYAGPVGWYDRDGNGVFALALRCALVDGNQATVYAGGGLVAGSTAEEELTETELKLRPILDALN